MRATVSSHTSNELVSTGLLSSHRIELLILDVRQGQGSGLGVFLVRKGSDFHGHVPASAPLEVELLAICEGLTGA